MREITNLKEYQKKLKKTPCKLNNNIQKSAAAKLTPLAEEKSFQFQNNIKNKLIQKAKNCGFKPKQTWIPQIQKHCV